MWTPSKPPFLNAFPSIHYAVNACIAPLCAVHGVAVTTVEGLGSVKTSLHPIQRQLAQNHATQCGFCTPGIIMSMYALLRNHPTPTKQQLYEAFDGNLCRCTGYRPILEGLYPFTDCKVTPCTMGEACCKNQRRDSTVDVYPPSPEGNGSHFIFDKSRKKFKLDSKPKPLYDPTQEPIFPPELKLMSPKLVTEYLRFESDRCTWLRPTSLQQLLEIKETYPDCKLVTGNTEIGIEVKFQKRHFKVMVSPAFVKELREVKTTDLGIQFGASVTLTDMEKHLRLAVQTMPEERTRVFIGFLEMLKWFAGHQIRNVASLGGNVMNASPISDLNPLLMACNAEIEFAAAKQGHRRVKIDTDFFRGYKKTRVRPLEILVSITIPFSSEVRKDAYFSYLLEEESVCPEDSKWDNSLLEYACSKDLLQADLPLPVGAPGGMVAYRKTLTLSFFFRFYLSVLQRIEQKVVLASPCPESEVSGAKPLTRGPSQGCQFYAMSDDVKSHRDTIGRPLIHRAAYKQCTGEAFYMDDVPVSQAELFLGLVTSKKAHARLLNVDLSPAEGMPGVVDVIDYRDVPSLNEWESLEVVFATDEVTHEGQVIAAVVAETHAQAQRAAHCVKVTYQDLEPVVSIKDAIQKNSFYPIDIKVDTGDVSTAFSQCEHTVTGEMHVSAQEHLYLEPHGCIVYPRDGEEIEVIATTQSPTQMQVRIVNIGKARSPTQRQISIKIIGVTQSPTQRQGSIKIIGVTQSPTQRQVSIKDIGTTQSSTQRQISIKIIGVTQSPTQRQKALMRVLGLPANRIVVKVKRLGGGFGGKETRNVSVLLPTAVAALKTKRPVRGVLDRDEDMCLTGTRHPAYVTYKIGFNSDGKIHALDADLYLNMGHSIDLSPAVLETALLGIDSSYNIKNFRVKGHLCLTNLTSCTAFRGFGGPQAIIMAENWVTHVADYLGMSQEAVRERNLYKDGDTIPCGQVIKCCNVMRCWQECITNSDFDSRLEEVNDYNRKHRWKKRGIAITPLKYGLAFLLQSMNQGGALIQIYTDGSVLLAHGGIEMGQGLHTKMIQVVSRELDIPVANIHVSETSTSTVPNTGPTAASMSSDLYGAAVLDACKTLQERLAPYREAQPKATLKQWAHAAHQDKVCLSATGFYKLDGVNLDWSRATNNPFSYFSFGAACSEVEIDCLTGDHQVTLRKKEEKRIGV
ncbi:xanthine dehydrogenase/oxidase-like [Plakobranchus ocellatus]|uniref:xanthine dehydrogenase n=1 Tax=Plakobranchus ocellatus TaxID=259542 RepID=A0AAV3ZFD0_9GAST|nr:xanthine dehydrogenase/oxidase-like [Plakobranchus ocellatus]